MPGSGLPRPRTVRFSRRSPGQRPDLPARVYLHILQEADRLRAELITRDVAAARLLNGQALILPGIVLVKTDPPKESQLRCFKREACDGYGSQLVKLFQDRNVTLKLTDLSRTYAGSIAIRPNHFEVWFAKNIP